MTEFNWPVRVYYEDTDAGGIVYYANYLKFCERARTEWLRSFGVEQDLWLREGIGFVVRKAELDLVAPGRFNDELLVSCEVEKVRKVSINFTQRIYRKNGELLCQARVLAACVDIIHMKPEPIPAPILEVITRAR